MCSVVGIVVLSTDVREEVVVVVGLVVVFTS